MNEMIWEDVDEAETSEYPFRFFADVPSLQQLVSYRISQEMWHVYISSHKVSTWDIMNDDDEDYHEGDPLAEKLETLVEDFKLHKPVEKKLKRDVLKTFNGLKNWASCFYEDDSTSDGKAMQRLWFDANWCTWLPNGEIDYRTSATKMLHSGRLNEKQKFFVMCIFCMEDEMKTISQGTIQYFSSRIKLEVNCLLFYWVCYLRNELERIPINPGSNLAKTMFCRCWRSPHKIGLEYFWQHLSNDDRISLANEFPSNDFVDCSTTLERLYSSITSAVVVPGYLKISLKKSTSLRYPLVVWNRFKNQITDQEFASIFADVFEKLVGNSDRMQLLEHIWDTAYDHQREYLVQHKVNAIFSMSYNTPCSSTCNVIRQILLQKPEDQRLELLLQKVDSLAGLFIMPPALIKVLDFCLPNSSHRSRFKHALSRSKRLQSSCVRLLEYGTHDDFDRRLSWVFSDCDPNALNEYKKLILASMTWKNASAVKTLFATIDDWKQLIELIDQTYAEDHESASELKRMLVEAGTRITRYDRNFRKNFNVLREIIEMIIPAQDLDRFKCNHLYALGQRIQSEKYWNDEQDGDQIFLRNFVEWCCDGDVGSISRFKKSVPREAILEAVVRRLLSVRFDIPSRSELEKLLHRLDWYLKWFIGSDQEVAECKLQAIEYSTIEMIGIRHPNLRKMSPHWQLILRWFCGGDEAAKKKLMLM